MNHGSANHTSVGIFRTKWLARFARRERITDESLREAIGQAERGIADAELGAGLIKRRSMPALVLVAGRGVEGSRYTNGPLE